MNRIDKVLRIAAWVLLPVAILAWLLTLVEWFLESKSFEPINALVAIAISGIWWLAFRGSKVRKIKSAFEFHTQKALKNIRVEITGITGSVQREELFLIEDQFENGLPVLLSGEPGTGKSGVAMFVARAAIAKGKIVLCIDARFLQNVKDEAGLRQAFSMSEPLSQTIHGLSKNQRVLLVIDQFDNAVNSDIANVLVELAIECHSATVDVLVVSRSREGHESKLIKRLTDRKFVTIPCREITVERSSELLELLGIDNASPELIGMCTNLLNLDIVATIKNKEPTFDFSNVFDEVALWDGYTDMIVDREAKSSNLETADQMLAEAMALARHALQTGKQTFVIDQLTATHRRLDSWGVILSVEGQVYRFGHEKLQDYLYARYATDRCAMPTQVLADVNSIKSKSIFAWIEQIYAARNSPFLAQFVEETLNG